MKYATLVIFVKEPRFGKVKTRLAKDIGKFKAWVFYRRTLKALINRIGCGNWKTVICVSPDNYIGNFFDERYKIIDQGGGDPSFRRQQVMHQRVSATVDSIGGYDVITGVT